MIEVLFCLASLVAQMVKNLPAMQETWVRSLGWEDPLEENMATHSSILAWRIPGTGEPGGLPSMWSHRVRHDIFPSGSVSKESACNSGDLGSSPGLRRSSGGEHGNPLQYSSLENPHGQRILACCSPWDHRVRHDSSELAMCI